MRKSDFRVVAVCLVAIACMGGLYWAVDSNVTLPEKEGTTQRTEHKNKQRYFSDYKQVEPKLQRFDPNTADSTTLLNLGLPPFIVRSIYKYRAMGGVYSSAEDFARVPGLTQKQYKVLLPYITIADDYKPARLLVSEDPLLTSPRGGNRDEDREYQQKMKSTERLSLNTADTTALKKVPGIGSYFAKKIVELRSRYGGFNSLDQLLEIKSFPESALEYLTIPDGDIRRLNINTASFQQLAKHPYIGYSRTKAIIEYRKLKGKITSLRQLSLIPGFSDEEIHRMEAYVEF